MSVVFQFSVGNLARRAPADPVAVAPAAEDTLLPLVNLANDFPDEQGGLTWRADGAYDIDFDLNLLAIVTARADAPTGWADLLLRLAGTPGLPANPPDWDDYGGRTTVLRVFWPSYQDVAVMPGEDLTLNIGLYRDSAAAGATGARVRVVDLFSGKGWDGAAWTDGGVLATQIVTNTWLDVSEEITADTGRGERSIYRVTVEPVAASYDATSFVYFSLNGTNGSPALVAEADVMAIIGHNIPDDAVVALGATAMSPASPSFLATDASVYTQTWRLSVDMPSGNQHRPIIGEVWIGKVRSLLGKSPVLPFSIVEGDPNQQRLESQGGRVEVLGTGVPTRASMVLNFTFDQAAYVQARDEVARLTRNGEEPLLLLTSDTFEGAGRFYHGRLGSEVAYSRTTPGDADALRSFGWEFEESPMAAE